MNQFIASVKANTEVFVAGAQHALADRTMRKAIMASALIQGIKYKGSILSAAKGAAISSAVIGIYGGVSALIDNQHVVNELTTQYKLEAK